MGYALAEAAARGGAKVILITGPTYLSAPADVHTIRVETTREMLKEILANIKKADILIMAGAPSDFTTQKVKGKIRRTGRPISIKLTPTPDILKEIPEKEGLIKIGFAAEIGNLIPRAYRKLKEKRLDIIIANDISRKDIGFESDYNKVYIIKKDRTVIETPRLRKDILAAKIFLYILDK